MSLPVGTRVRAVPHFIDCLHAARAFFVAQDAASAARCFQSLQGEIVRAQADYRLADPGG